MSVKQRMDAEIAQAQAANKVATDVPQKPEYYQDSYSKPKEATREEQKKADLEKHSDALLNPLEYPALAASRKPKTKKEINKEAIRIRYGKIVKRVPRKRLAVEIMNKAFKCDIHYLMDKTRTVFFPHEWKAKLLPWSEGVTYRIVVKTDAPPEEDPFDEYEYVGDAEVFITNLPLDDQADEECMVRWLKEGILDGDQMYKDACQELEAKEEAIINVKKRLKDLPFLTLEGRSQEQEAAERKALKVFLESELVRLQAERKVNKQTKLGLEMETMTLPIELEKCNVREDFLIFDFRVTINVDPEKRRILYQQIVHKEDWFKFRVFRDILTKNFKHPRRFVIIKGAPPDSWDRNKEVNLRGVRVVRQKHNQGMLRFGVDANHIYSGTFRQNKFQGSGELSTPHGFFKGPFEDNHFGGIGFTYLANGTAYHGNHVPVYHHQSDFERGKTLRSLLPNHDRYSGGAIQHVEKDLVAQYKAAAKKQQIEEGEEVIPEEYAPAQAIFPDGAVYKGEIRLGLVSGQGKYVGADGTTLEGTFVNGVLEGPGRRTSSNGYIWEGTFVHGRLRGKGTIRHKAIEHVIYEGTFDNDKFDGHGVRTIDCSGDGDYRYIGFYSNGMRDGYGRMLFGNFTVCKDEDTGRIYYDYDKVFTGNWQGNKYRMQGMTASLPEISFNEDFNYYTTHNLDILKYPWLSSLAQKEDDLEAKLDRLKRQIKYKAMDIRTKSLLNASNKFKKRFKTTAVECEFKLQQKDENRKNYLRELDELEERVRKARQEKIDSERAVRRDAVIRQMLNAHKQIKKKVNLSEDQIQTVAMKDKVMEIEKASEAKRLAERHNEGTQQTAAAKREAEKLKQINMNRRRQGLNPVKSLDELKKKPVEVAEEKEPTPEEMRAAIMGGGGK